VHNTMDVEEAIQAAKNMRPKLVIPCHYNCPAFFTKTYNPADDELFKYEVESKRLMNHVLALNPENQFLFC
ncbi:MAG: hypothetical protein KAI44_10170, partial [Methylococcales bacterium]|nr:hypothetical protein [Methylococcales bacterium]